jgi:hypothetical protein
VESSCEHGNEPSVSIKCWGSSEVAAQLAASQEGLSFMGELYSYKRNHKLIPLTRILNINAKLSMA